MEPEKPRGRTVAAADLTAAIQKDAVSRRHGGVRQNDAVGLIAPNAGLGAIQRKRRLWPVRPLRPASEPYSVHLYKKTAGVSAGCFPSRGSVY